MRCDHCAAQVPAESRYCPICGQPIGGESIAPVAGAAHRGPAGAAIAPSPASMSLFALPVSRGARLARIAAVVILDLVLAGAGVAMIASYLSERAEAARRRSSTPAVVVVPADVEALEPSPVEVERVRRAPAKRAARTPPRHRRTARSRRAATGSSRARAAAAVVAPPAADPPAARAPAAAAPADEPPDDDGGAAVGATEPPRVPSAATEPPRVPSAATEPPSAPAGATDPPSAPPLSFSRIRRVVDRHRVQLRKCYQQAAKQASLSQPLAGRVDLQFVITPDGNASNVRAVSNTTGSGKLARCLAGSVAGWQFPSSGGEEIALVWPFVFKAP